MTNTRISVFSATLLSLVSIFVLVWWIQHDPSSDFVVFEPGLDNEPIQVNSSKKNPVNIGENWTLFDSSAVKPSGSWPRFRGADYTNMSRAKLDLSQQFLSEPEVLWSHELGEGHAGPAIHNGRVYLLDYSEESHSDVLRCFALEDGRELWQRSYAVKVKRNPGISRTTPAVTDDFVVSMGPRCHVMCVDAESGNLLWGLDLVKDYGATTPLWYTGQCPLIDENVAVLATGGSNLMIGLDCMTGEILWETPNPKAWKMSHSSIIPMTLDGVKQYVYCADGGIVSVSAEPENLGSILWETDLWNHNVTAPSPLDLGAGRIFVTAGYSAGGMLLQVNQDKGHFTVDSLQRVLPHTGMASEQQTPIFYEDRLFGILPKDAGALNGQFACFSADDISNVIWSSGKDNRFGLGPYILADDKFFILDDDGVLTVIEASIHAYKQLSRVKILPGPDAWAPLAIVDGKLIARDSKRMVCLNISQSGIL